MSEVSKGKINTISTTFYLRRYVPINISRNADVQSIMNNQYRVATILQLKTDLKTLKENLKTRSKNKKIMS